jgi:hypothetical protein
MKENIVWFLFGNSAKRSYQRGFLLRGIQTTILYEEMAPCKLLLCFFALWLKWHVTREVRDIYETAKDAKEVEQRLRDLIDYMKWKSDQTLSAYQHYFEHQLYADMRDDFHQRMHAEVQQYLDERQQRGRREKPTQHQQKEPVPSLSAVPQFDNEPDLVFLYRLAGEE